MSYPQSDFNGLRVAHAATFGGMMSIFGRYLIQTLIANGADMHFIASNKQVYGLEPPIEELEAMGGKFHGINMGHGLAAMMDVGALTEMTILLKQLELSILHTRGTVMGFIGRLAGRLAGISQIFHHQDDLFARDRRLGPISRHGIGYIEAAISRLGHKNFFVSQPVLEDAVNYGFKKQNSIVVGNDLQHVFLESKESTDLNAFRSSLYHDIGFPQKGIVIGCIARLLPLKGIDTLIEIAQIICRQHPHCLFLIKGDGPLKEKLMSQIKEKCLSRRVFIYDKWVSIDQLPLFFRIFDIFLLPTRREGFGMVFVEAMAVGLPVVGPRIPPVTSVVPADCGFLVEPENIRSYCDVLSELIKSPDLRQMIGKNGQLFSHVEYGGAKSAERTFSVYCDVLKKLKNKPTNKPLGIV